MKEYKIMIVPHEEYLVAGDSLDKKVKKEFQDRWQVTSMDRRTTHTLVILSRQPRIAQVG